MNKHVQAYLKTKGYEINDIAQTIIREADDWYRVRETDRHKKVTVNGMTMHLSRMGFAKRAAADDANLCEVVSINAGKNDAFVQSILAANQFDTQYRRQLELTSAEGTTACYVRLDNADVMTDGSVQGGEIRLNWVEAGGFLPLTVENDDILEAAFWGDSYKGTKESTTLVICTRDDNGIYSYETVVFAKDGKEESVETAKLGEVKPFAVMRTGEVNNIDGMKGYGYPKVYGSIPVFLGLDAAFTALFGDVESAEKLTFINEQLCGFDENGKPIAPNEAQKKRFIFLGQKLPQADSLIKTEAPEVRVGMFRETIELLLSVMSVKFGYGTKKYSFDGAQIATASQYIGERQDMMQELNKQRYQAQQYIQGVIRAALWFYQTYQNGDVHPSEEIQIEFDDSYIESRADQLESMRQDAVAGLGGVGVKQRYLMKRYNLTEEEALRWATNDDAYGETVEDGA